MLINIKNLSRSLELLNFYHNPLLRGYNKPVEERFEYIKKLLVLKVSYGNKSV